MWSIFLYQCYYTLLFSAYVIRIRVNSLHMVDYIGRSHGRASKGRKAKIYQDWDPPPITAQPLGPYPTGSKGWESIHNCFFHSMGSCSGEGWIFHCSHQQCWLYIFTTVITYLDGITGMLLDLYEQFPWRILFLFNLNILKVGKLAIINCLQSLLDHVFYYYSICSIFFLFFYTAEFPDQGKIFKNRLQLILKASF